ncbi:sugar phosphate nucleotidyltransferase [Boudabousia marimammalium]|uniref:Glucose-1-phosphate thymidylyltransferase n=1 Tax=Boudabousia marimammalium TaxID=156892 RepID=A0A1Q5PSK0_9ACTO|nr:sugar phosphate nucleotidyltransferase [Boudabousia marimammalium]OKL50513.1 glucose-1-phosphate thymidylyltransferase [Boudabousia marimammalium]
MIGNTKKAVILARGLGTRMRAEAEGAQLNDEQAKAANAGVKGMIDVGRPFLDYVMSALADAGCTEICLVIGPEHDMMRDYYGNLNSERINVHFAIQEKPLGTADAVLAAEEFAGDDAFIVVNSDNYYSAAALTKLAALDTAGLLGYERNALIEQSNIPADRIAAFAIMDYLEDGTFNGILEKPAPEVLAARPDAGISMNAWRFTKPIFAACKNIESSIRGEYELADAVRYAIDHGTPFSVVDVAEGVLDMSRRTDIAAVKEALSDVVVTL